MGIKHYHIFVNGLVQGVGYRASTFDQAEKRHLSGWVKNLSDGRVEISVQGEEDQVQSFIDWCNEGPRFAEVAGLEITELSPEASPEPFHVRR
jgi:acylphosphatase